MTKRFSIIHFVCFVLAFAITIIILAKVNNHNVGMQADFGYFNQSVHDASNINEAKAAESGKNMIIYKSYLKVNAANFDSQGYLALYPNDLVLISSSNSTGCYDVEIYSNDVDPNELVLRFRDFYAGL